ncbi:MAG: 50S ribosomal protein L9 [Anaerolineales bacterium]
MKVLLLQDVYKLGRAGDVKKVANGYGRNYLIPQGFAVLATAGALRQADNIRARAEKERTALNQEMSAVAEKLAGVVLTFAVRASETGKLYGSVTTQMLADALNEKTGLEISRRQIESQPLRSLGVYEFGVRLTVDLVPTIKAIVHREGELPMEEIEAETEAEAEVEAEETEEAPEA